MLLICSIPGIGVSFDTIQVQSGERVVKERGQSLMHVSRPEAQRT